MAHCLALPACIWRGCAESYLYVLIVAGLHSESVWVAQSFMWHMAYDDDHSSDNPDGVGSPKSSKALDATVLSQLGTTKI